MPTQFESEQQPHLQEIASLLQSITDAPSQKTKPANNRIRYLGVVAVCLVIASGCVWHHRTQPITDRQHAILTALVARVVKESDQSSQKVWSGLHKRFEIRRGRHLKRGDFDAAMEYLIGDVRP